MKTINILVLLFLCLGACSEEHELGQETHYSQTDLLLCEDMGSNQCKVHKLVNEERVSRGLSPLAPSFSCSQAAQSHGEDMDNNNYFSHNSSQESWTERMSRFGIQGLRAENIAMGSDPASVVDVWMSSEAHRNNILNPHLSYTGVGFSGEKWVQCFSAYH